VKVVAAYSIKGGVGKTTAAVNLAYLAALQGYRTLLWDLDPQGAATYLFRVKPKVKGGAEALVRRRHPLADAVKETDFPGLDLVPADPSNRSLDLLLDATKQPERRLRQRLQSLEDEYEVVVLDCAPSISLLSENVVRAADVVVVPLIPAPLSLRTLDQLRSFLDETGGRRPAVVAYFSMADRRRRSHREVLEAAPSGQGDISAVTVPAASQVEQMGGRRAPLAVFAPRSEAAAAFRLLWAEVAAAAGLSATGPGPDHDE
jgi:chromosome partitioning protein